MPAFRKAPKMGRPPELTPEIIDAIVNAMRAGAYVETAAVIAGASKVTLYAWLKKAHKQKTGIFRDLLNAVEKAFEECNMRDLLNIDKCAMGRETEYMRDEHGGIVFSENGKPIVLKQGAPADWSASAWRMERRNAKTWSRVEKREQVDASGATVAPVQIIVTIPSNGREAPKK